MGRCPLLITHIHNGHQTTTVTTTSHRSREMAVSLGPQRTLVTGTKTEPVTVTQHQKCILCLQCLHKMRRIYFTHVSAQLGFVTGIKQQPLPQLVNGHVKMTISLGPQGTLVIGTRTEPVTVKSISEMCVMNLRLRSLDERAKFWSPPVSTGNGLSPCLLHCWHVCNGCFE
jgi:hypothetical protein